MFRSIFDKDIASWQAVAGVMGTSLLFPFMYKGITSTFDVTNSGIYQIGGATEDSGLPVGAYGFGILIVFCATDFTVQIYISDAYSKMYVRTKNTGAYTSWKTISVS